MTSTPSKQGYRNDISNSWLLEQEVRCFANFARYWDGPVNDSDCFNVVSNSRFGEESAFLEVLLRHGSAKALAECGIVEYPSKEATEDEPSPVLPEDVVLPAHRKLRRFSFPRRLSDDISDTLRRMWQRKKLRKTCRAVIEDITQALLADANAASQRAPDPMAARFAEIVSFLSLDPVSADVLAFAIVRDFSCFRDTPIRFNSLADRASFIAMALDRPVAEVSCALRVEAPLRRFELLNDDAELCAGPFRDYLENGSDTLLEGRFYKRTPVDDALPLSFHGDLAARHVPILKSLLSTSGPHAPAILFYGPPGTGKTSLAKTLARELSLGLVEIRQGDTNGHIDTTARLTGFRLANERVPAGQVLVLVDEADKILRTSDGLFSFFGRPPSTEKGIVNDPLDNARLPSIWISNAPASALDESVRRRFDYSIRFEAITPETRLSIWRNTVARLGLSHVLPAAAVQRLCERFPTNAGGIANALQNLKAAHIPRRRAESFLADLLVPHCELLGLPVQASAPASSDYSPDILDISGDTSPDQILAAVRRFRSAPVRLGDPDRPRLNLLFYGPPGTGKTEFAKHLARESGARLTTIGGSELLSKYVGETEALIRRAFDRARSEHAILFLDEADGLLMERAAAERSWELSQVNELLRAIEEFEGVFIAATNFMDRLDPAVLRRFTLKFRFGYLTPSAKRTLFERMFHQTLSPSDADRLDAIPNLVPGDFRTVRQSFHYLGTSPTPSALLSSLAAESALKRDAPSSHPFGFVP